MLNKKLLLLFFCAIFSGCYFFGFQGIFNKNEYYIVKVELNNQTYYAPQALAKDARKKLNAKFESKKQDKNIYHKNMAFEYDTNNKAQNATNKNSKNNQHALNDKNIARNVSDELDSDFANLENRNALEDGAVSSKSQSTSLQDLASITLKSTFILDRGAGTINGQAGCNNYTAKFFWQGRDKIVISGSASTRAICNVKEVAEFQNALMSKFDGIFYIRRIKSAEYLYVLDNGAMKIYIK